MGHLTAHQTLDDAGLGEFINALHQGFDGMAIPDDGDLVSAVGQLIELVGDQDAGDAPLAFELQQQVEQVLRVAFVQGRSRLVQDQQLDILGKRFGDLHQLLLAHADVLDQGTGVIPQAHHGHVLRSLLVGQVPVDHAGGRALIAQEHIFRDAQVGHQRQFLVDNNDAQALAVLDVVEAAFLALKDDIPLIGAKGIDAAENVHQRGFARAVLAADGVDLAFFDFDVHLVQRFHAGEDLGDVLHFEKRVAQVTFLQVLLRGDGRRIRPSPLVDCSKKEASD